MNAASDCRILAVFVAAALLSTAGLLLAGCPRSGDQETPPACENGSAGPCFCGPAGEVCDAGHWCDALAEACVIQVSDKCGPGTSWGPGAILFEEVTEEWGLIDLGVQGQRISVADFDGDGYPDLAVRRAGGGADDFSSGGHRSSWLLRNTGHGIFEDVTQSSGFAARRRGDPSELGRPMEVVIFADVDGDGHLDAFTSWKGGDESGQSSEIMLGDGTGGFILGPEDNPLRREGKLINIAGAAFVDIGRNGQIDLWLGHGVQGASPAQDRLYRGDGGGRFYDHTAGYGLVTRPWSSIDDLNAGLAHSNSWAAAACDLDGDGIPELLSSSYGRAPNHLWLGRLDDAGRVIFENHSVASGYAYDHRMDWTDNESARCYCMHNRHLEECADVPTPRWIRCMSENDAFRWNHATDREPYRLGGNSAATVCADITGDGRLDLFTTEIVHWDVGSSSDPSEVLVNTGETPLRFERPGPDVMGMTRPREVPWDDGDMTAAVFDADNSGRMDILIGSSDYPGTRAWLYLQREDGTFVPVPLELGVDHKSSHGVGVADFNQNGALDLVLGHSRTRCSSGDHCYETAQTRLFQNVLASEGNFIQVDLVGGARTNRSAIGAQVTVLFGDRIQLQEVDGGHGHYGAQKDRVLHFGLGPECEAEVTIRWPDRDLTEQRFRARTGYRYRVVQGEAPVPVEPGH